MTTDSAYRPEIDGMRALAVLAILLHHAGIAWLPGGYLGVDIFFVISGYVLTRLMLLDLASDRFTLTSFWQRRMRRILPALVVLLAVCVPFAWMLLTPALMADFLPVFLGATVLAPNIVLWNQIGYFSPGAEVRPLLHLWSLGVEEQFYLLYPLIMTGLWRHGPKWLVSGLAVLALASFLLASVQAQLSPSAGFYLLPARVWELLAGALAAFWSWAVALRLRQVASLAGFGLILGPLLTYVPQSPGPATLVPVLGIVLLLGLAGPSTLVGRVLSTRPMVLVGKVSFGAYLWHWPLLSFTRIYLADEPSLAAKLGLMGLALGIGWASWRLVETPFRRSDRPLWPRLGTGAGLAALACLAVLGATLLLVEARGLRQLNWPGFEPQKIAALEAERRQAAGTGPCHRRDELITLAAFRAGWDCRPDDRDGRHGWPVAVFGDSNASDFAGVLRKTGHNPLQMTGSGCSLVPSQMNGDCAILADDLRRMAQEAGVHVVILANLWQSAELTPEALVEMETWWGKAFDTVVVVSPLPVYPNLAERLVRWPIERLVAIVPDTGDIDAFTAARRRIEGSDLVVIDAVSLFCGNRPGCPPLDGTGPLALDEYGHLAPAGSQAYADRLEVSGDLDGLLP